MSNRYVRSTLYGSRHDDHRPPHHPMTLLSAERPVDDARTSFFRAVLRDSLRKPAKQGKRRQLSVLQAASLANLSRPTAQGFHALLRDSGVAPPDRVEINSNAGYVFGVDLRETNPVRVAVCDARGELQYLWDSGEPRRAAELLDVAHEGVVACIEWLIDQDQIATAAELDRKLIGIGISLQGPVVDSLAVGADAGPWNLIRADQGLAKRLSSLLPSLDVETWDEDGGSRDPGSIIVTRSDAYASAVVERLWGAPEAAADQTIYVKWSVDLRASIIVDGELYSGHNGIAGELGHIMVDSTLDNPPTCAVCKSENCVHAVASLEYLGAIARDVAAGDKAIKDVKENHQGLVSGREIGRVAFASRASHDQRLIDALKVAATGIGTAVASYVAALDPETVVVGGAIGSRVFKLVEEQFKAPIARGAPRNSDRIKIVQAEKESNTSVLGIAACALLECGPSYLRWHTSRMSALSESHAA
jgi:predicted NBD/HSP70 family sugar kinase